MAGYTAKVVALAAAALAAACTTTPRVPPPAPEGGAVIVDLESRFAEASRVRGARAAFLEFLAEDAIVLQPGPVWGRAAWESQQDFPGTLEWVPDRAALAASRDLGFATGRWVLTPRDPEGRVVEGRYLTVWKHVPEGWRVVFDGGFGRLPAGSPHSLDVAADVAPGGCEPGPAVLPGELQVLDLALSGSGESGPPHVRRLLDRAAAGFTVFLPPHVEGLRAPREVDAALSQLPGTTQLWPMGARIAVSGDLGFSYGLSAPSADTSADSTYANVWCRSSATGWRLLLQMRTRLSPP
jgi:ketosteroid isomerase-like protein